MRWNWEVEIKNMLKMVVVLACLAFVFQYRYELNAMFLPTLPVGYISLLAFSALFVRRIYYQLRAMYRRVKRGQFITNTIVQTCLYLVTFSVVLSLIVTDYKIYW